MKGRDCIASVRESDAGWPAIGAMQAQDMVVAAVPRKSARGPLPPAREPDTVDRTPPPRERADVDRYAADPGNQQCPPTIAVRCRAPRGPRPARAGLQNSRRPACRPFGSSSKRAWGQFAHLRVTCRLIDRRIELLADVRRVPAGAITMNQPTKSKPGRVSAAAGPRAPQRPARRRGRRTQRAAPHAARGESAKKPAWWVETWCPAGRC